MPETRKRLYTTAGIEAEVDRLREALAFYADPKSWDHIHAKRGTVTTDYPANRDRGQLARETLDAQGHALNL